jgi:hypothetical protein
VIGVKTILTCIIFLGLLLVTRANKVFLQEKPVALKYPFKPGEKLYYRMKYSIFTIGKAEVLVNPITYRISGKKYYRVDVTGRTAGAAEWVSTVNDTWGALLDSTDLLPMQSWRLIEEGRYRRKEYVDFDHLNRKIKVRVIDNKTGRFREPKVYAIRKQPVHDLISGYFLLRLIDFSSLKTGDTIHVNGFLEDTFYDMNILFMGKEEIETKLGYIKAFKLVPVMPDNKIFAGENSITAWFSADDVQIPLKIEARMFIGHVGCEITGLEGTRAYPHFRE